MTSRDPPPAVTITGQCRITFDHPEIANKARLKAILVDYNELLDGSTGTIVFAQDWRRRAIVPRLPQLLASVKHAVRGFQQPLLLQFLSKFETPTLVQFLSNFEEPTVSGDKLHGLFQFYEDDDYGTGASLTFAQFLACLVDSMRKGERAQVLLAFSGWAEEEFDDLIASPRLPSRESPTTAVSAPRHSLPSSVFEIEDPTSDDHESSASDRALVLPSVDPETSAYTVREPSPPSGPVPPHHPELCALRRPPARTLGDVALDCRHAATCLVPDEIDRPSEVLVDSATSPAEDPTPWSVDALFCSGCTHATWSIDTPFCVECPCRAVGESDSLVEIIEFDVESAYDPYLPSSTDLSISIATSACAVSAPPVSPIGDQDAGIPSSFAHHVPSSFDFQDDCVPGSFTRERRWLVLLQRLNEFRSGRLYRWPLTTHRALRAIDFATSVTCPASKPVVSQHGRLLFAAAVAFETPSVTPHSRWLPRQPLGPQDLDQNRCFDPGGALWRHANCPFHGTSHPGTIPCSVSFVIRLRSGEDGTNEHSSSSVDWRFLVRLGENDLRRLLDSRSTSGEDVTYLEYYVSPVEMSSMICRPQRAREIDEHSLYCPNVTRVLQSPSGEDVTSPEHYLATVEMSVLMCRLQYLRVTKGRALSCPPIDLRQLTSGEDVTSSRYRHTTMEMFTMPMSVMMMSTTEAELQSSSGENVTSLLEGLLGSSLDVAVMSLLIDRLNAMAMAKMSVLICRLDLIGEEERQSSSGEDVTSLLEGRLGSSLDVAVMSLLIDRLNAMGMANGGPSVDVCGTAFACDDARDSQLHPTAASVRSGFISPTSSESLCSGAFNVPYDTPDAAARPRTCTKANAPGKAHINSEVPAPTCLIDFGQWRQHLTLGNTHTDSEVPAPACLIDFGQWRQHLTLGIRHVPGIVSCSDAATKALACTSDIVNYGARPPGIKACSDDGAETLGFVRDNRLVRYAAELHQNL